MATETPMMACGHAANAQNGEGGPVCIICVGLHPGAETIQATPPDLSGRVARCGCGREEPSSTRLAFFEYLGAGSREAVCHCANCGFTEAAHGYDGRYAPNRSGKPSAINPNLCMNRGESFTPKGDVGHDRYYCGHAGWD